MSSLFSKGQLPVQQGYDEIVNGVYRSRKSTIIPGQGFIPSMNMSRPGNMQNGVSLLPGPITINGQTVEPIFRHSLVDGTVSTLPADGYGINAPIAGVGNDVIPNQGSPLLGSRDGSVAGDGGKSYQSAQIADNQLSTGDIYSEGIAVMGESAGGQYRTIWAKGSTVRMSDNGSEQFGFRLLSDDSSNALVLSAVLSIGARYFFQFFLNRSGFGQCYINSVTSGAAVDISGVTDDLSYLLKHTLLASPHDLTDANWKVITPTDYLAVYQKDNWLASHLNQSFANDRFATVIGTKAISARGTSIPTTATRASTAYLQKDTDNVVKLYAVGANWNRLERVTDLDGVKIEQWKTLHGLSGVVSL
jgi:hypothetical protein